MDKRITYVSTSNNCVFFLINAHMSASEAKGILLKENYLQIESVLTSEVEAKKYFTENPYSTARLYFLSKILGVEHYQRSIKEGDSPMIQEQILEKGIARTFTGNPSLVSLEPKDLLIVRKYSGT